MARTDMPVASPSTRCLRGFTLLEVLVVVVILAVLVSLVTVRIAPDARQSLREEATRLAAVLGHARDEAVVTGAAFAWQADLNGYRFVRRDPDRVWRTVEGDPTLGARTFPAGVGLAAVETPERTTNATPAIVIAPTGASGPFRITLALDEHRVHVSSNGSGRPVVEDER
jgi:general secretion pathway protein H